MQTCCSVPPWKAFVHLAFTLAAVFVLCLLLLLFHKQKAQRSPAPSPGPEWYAIAIDAPGTPGHRVLRPVRPRIVTKQGVESLPKNDIGKIIFNPLDRMTVGKMERVEAIITLSDVAEAIARLKGKGRLQIEQVKVASAMIVKLVGNDFKIIDLNTSQQSVDLRSVDAEPTYWAWNVMPLKPGKLPLTITATRVIQITGDGQVPRDLPSFERVIVVDADRWYSASHWIDDNKTWFIPTVLTLGINGLIPLGTWLVRRHRRRNRNRDIVRKLRRDRRISGGVHDS